MTIHRIFPQFANRSPLGARLCVALILATALPALAEINIPTLPTKPASSKKDTPLPPQPVPVTLQVASGGTVQIPLRIYGRQEQTIKYLIRKEPALGKIVSLKPASQEVWTLTYEQTAPMEDKLKLQDRILFAAQNNNGISSPAEITLNIVDAPPKLAGHEAIDFGEIHAGLPVEREMVITNAGGGRLEGTISVEEPWTVSSGSFNLGRGEKLTLRIGLTPGEVREYKDRLRFSCDPLAEAPLHARAILPFTVTPIALTLTGQTVRSGSATLTNRTDTKLRVEIEADERLGLPKTIDIPPRGTAPLKPALAADDQESINETVSLTHGTLSQNLTIRAAPVAAATPASTPAEEPVAPQPSPTPKLTRPGSVAATGTTGSQQPQMVPTTTEIFRFRDMAVRCSARGTVQFAWNTPAASSAEPPQYRVEILRLVLQDGKPQQHWFPLANVQVTEKAGRITALLSKIPSGTQATVRIRAFDADGKMLAESSNMSFSIPLPTRWFTMRNILFAGFTLMLVGALVGRHRQKKR